MLVLLMASAVAALAATDGGNVSTAWELVAQHLPRDALARLGKNAAPADREAAFVRAVIQMDSQPASDLRLQHVVAELTELARGNDEVAFASAYLVGRIWQVHFFTPDPARAAQAYATLAGQHPGTYWAQLALVKLALLKLYVLPEPTTPEARIAEVESFLAQVTEPDLQRDLQLVIGRARLFHRLPGVLPHLLAAAQAGGLMGQIRADLQVQVAELSRREGNLEQAKDYFQQFLAENEVDGRVYTVRMKLAEICAAQAARKDGAP